MNQFQMWPLPGSFTPQVRPAPGVSAGGSGAGSQGGPGGAPGSLGGGGVSRLKPMIQQRDAGAFMPMGAMSAFGGR